MIELIGFSGYARSGKDEATKAVAELGYERRAFADVLREFLLRLDPIMSESDDKLVRMSDVIDRYGWDGYKKSPLYGPEIRGLLQRCGTDCGRNLIHPDVWVRATLDKLGPGKYALADVRFPNEFKAIKENGGKVYRVVRNGIGPANSHPSETALDDAPFDEYIVNAGTLEEFHQNVRSIVSDNWV